MSSITRPWYSALQSADLLGRGSTVGRKNIPPGCKELKSRSHFQTVTLARNQQLSILQERDQHRNLKHKTPLNTEVTKNKTTLSPHDEHIFKGNPCSHVNWSQTAGVSVLCHLHSSTAIYLFNIHQVPPMEQKKDTKNPDMSEAGETSISWEIAMQITTQYYQCDPRGVQSSM